MTHRIDGTDNFLRRVLETDIPPIECNRLKLALILDILTPQGLTHMTNTNINMNMIESH